MSLPITLRCPACAHEWLAAILEDSDGITPEAIAKQPYCPRCGEKPPMTLVPTLRPSPTPD